MEQKPNQQQQAYNLYLQTEMTQEQIADMLSINRKTLYLWIKQGNWQRVKRSALYTPSMLADQYYRQLLAMNEHIEMREEQPYPTKEESDVIRKLTLTIKQIKNRQTLNESLETMTLFMEHLQRDNMELAQQIGPYSISYINSLASKNPIEKALAGLTEEQEFNNPDNTSSPSERQGEASSQNTCSPSETCPDDFDKPGEASGINGAFHTTQPIDSQYADAPSQEDFDVAHSPNMPHLSDENNANDEETIYDSANIKYTSHWDEEKGFTFAPIPADPHVIKRGNITIVKGKSPLMDRSAEERLNILHNPNPDKFKDVPNLWQSEETSAGIRNKEEHPGNRRRISKY